MAGEANRLQPAWVLELEQAMAMAGEMEAGLVARGLQAAAVGGTGAAATGTRGAVRVVGRPPSAAVAPEPLREAARAMGTAVEATEGERRAAEATMPAVAATTAMLEEVTAMPRVAGTPEGGYLPAEGTPRGAKNGRTWKPAEPRRRRSTDSPAGAARAAAAHARPAARRTRTRPAAEA